MKVYVAGKNPERAQAFMRRLSYQGHTITYDWTSLGKIDYEADPRRSGTWAADMASGVRRADATVLLWEDNQLGAILETGMAIALRQHVIVVAPERVSIFWHLPNVRRAPDEDGAIEELKLLA